jgi:hypothetical protein
MVRPLIRQVFVLLLTVFVTVGLGLSAVQASTMNVKMMDMSGASMASSDGGSCHDCVKPGDSKGTVACVTTGCIAPAATHVPSLAVLNVTFMPVHYLHQDLALLGRESRPDPYPPRIRHIG